MTEHQQVSPEDCPDPSVHGDPFRYCPYCTWIEEPEAPPAEATSEATSEAPSHDWPDETVEQIRLAEASAQRSLCVIPEGDLPDELAQALERRVEVNLAQYDGGDVRRVGSTDPHVRELEAPWTRKARRAAGSVDHNTQEGQS